MVAPLGLGQPVEVLLLGLPGLPGGAVDALELRVLLITSPVRACHAHQLERRDVPGRRQMRAATQVLPGRLAVAPEVVVDGQLAATDLDRRILPCRATLEADELELVRLASELRTRLLLGDRTPSERLALLDDLLHSLFDLLQIVRFERLGDVEVVIEAVLDRWADPQFGVREQLLDGLRHHVRGGVSQDCPSAFGIDLDRLDCVTVGQHMGEIDELVADASGDHVRSALEQVGGSRARTDLSLVSGDDDADLFGHDWTP